MTHNTNIDELIRAAEDGSSQSQCKLGEYYFSGELAEKDPEKCVYWFLEAAKQGNPLAMANLGRIYAEGIIVKKNLSYAIYCFAQAIGFGCSQDVWKILFEKIEFKEVVSSAESGNPSAQCILGICYGDGIGIDKNTEMAVYWYKEAAMQNEPLALLMYGYRLSVGNGVEKDLFLSEKVLRRAVLQGVHRALKYLEDVEAEKIAAVSYYLVKITDNEWADMLMDGSIRMCALEEYTRSEHVDKNDIFDEIKKDTFRTDPLEGLAASQHTMPFFQLENDNLEKINVLTGLVDALTLYKKIFCFYALEYDEKNKHFIKPPSQLRDFGDSAVVITDPKKFFDRILDALKEEYGDKFWLTYKRVSYNIDIFKKGIYNEFCKSPSYSWQNEFRIAIDISDNKFSNDFFHKESTDYAMIDFLNNGGKIDNDNGVKPNNSPVVLKIDISDICIKMPISELLCLKHDLFKNAVEPPKIISLENEQEPRSTLIKPVFVGDDAKLIFSAKYIDCVIL